MMVGPEDRSLRGGVICYCGQEWEVTLRPFHYKSDDGMTNERKNITQPADWWEAFEKQAKAEGMTLAAWLGEAAKAKLPAKVAKKLTDRPPANRPKKSE